MLVSIQPHRTRRPLISIATPRQRMGVVRLINPAFDRYLRAAEAAADRVIRDGWFGLAGMANHQFRVRLDNPSQLRAYIGMLSTPRPRFPSGGRARLLALWDRRPRGARIEVTESMVLIALRSLPVR